MLAFLNYALTAYVLIGSVVTLYVIVFYFFTGVTIFEGEKKSVMPFRYKVSYVFVTSILCPLLYIAFIDEITSLKRLHKLRVAHS